MQFHSHHRLLVYYLSVCFVAWKWCCHCCHTFCSVLLKLAFFLTCCVFDLSHSFIKNGGERPTTQNKPFYCHMLQPHMTKSIAWHTNKFIFYATIPCYFSSSCSSANACDWTFCHPGTYYHQRDKMWQIWCTACMFCIHRFVTTWWQNVPNGFNRCTICHSFASTPIICLPVPSMCVCVCVYVCVWERERGG